MFKDLNKTARDGSSCLSSLYQGDRNYRLTWLDSVRLCPKEMEKKTRQQQKDLHMSFVERWTNGGSRENGRKEPLFFRDTVLVSRDSQDSGEPDRPLPI